MLYSNNMNIQTEGLSELTQTVPYTAPCRMMAANFNLEDGASTASETLISSHQWRNNPENFKSHIMVRDDIHFWSTGRST